MIGSYWDWTGMALDQSPLPNRQCRTHRIKLQIGNFPRSNLRAGAAFALADVSGFDFGQLVCG